MIPLVAPHSDFLQNFFTKPNLNRKFDNVYC
jgi:hypothetical protein